MGDDKCAKQFVNERLLSMVDGGSLGQNNEDDDAVAVDDDDNFRMRNIEAHQ
jgi:hypothetical protein